MKRMNKLLKCVPIAMLWLLQTPIFAQNIEVNFASNRDSVGIEGDVIRVPILLDTVHTNDILGENIIALNLTFSHDALLIPQTFDFSGGLIETWSVNTTITENDRFTITAAGVSPLALDSGLLFYVDFILGDVSGERNPTFTIYNGSDSDNYFNEGGYDFTMDFGQIKINPILELSVSASPVRITNGDSTRINVSGGTAPYAYSLTDPTFGTFVSDNYFLSQKYGFAEVQVEDVDGIQGSVMVEVRPFRLDLEAPEDPVLPGDNFAVYLTTTDVSELNVISGSFQFTHGGNSDIQFLDTDATGYLMEGYSIEVDFINDQTYQIAFAGAAAIGMGDTLMAINFSLSEAPTNNSESIAITDNTIVFNENLLGNRGPNAPIQYVDLVEPNITFPSGQYVAGDQIQFAVSGGTAPYTWSTSNSSVATIDETGLLSVHQGGKLSVIVSDDLNVISEVEIDLYDGVLDIADHSSPVGSQYLLPIGITELPEGREFSAFSIDFTYDDSKVKFMGAVNAGSLTENFSLVENSLSETKARVVGGNTMDVRESGNFIYLSFLLDNLSDGETTTISLNDIQFNEGEPIMLKRSGSIRAGLSPTTDDVSLTIDEDELYTFSESDFPYDHPDVNSPLSSVRFISLPEAGTLNYFGSPMSLNQHVSISSLGSVTYQANLDESGAGYASFDFFVVDNANVPSNYPATLTFDVSSINDAPSFVLSQNSVSLDEDFTDPTVVQFTVDMVPTNEVGQSVTYSITPETLDFANMVFDQNNLTLTFTAVADVFGSESVTIIADDVQPENNTYNQVLSVSVNSINDAPIIADQGFNLQENTGNGTVVGILTVSDVDHSEFTFTINSGNTDDAFFIDNSTRELRVNNVSAIDFETNPTFTLSIDVSDGTSNASAIITVSLTDVDEAVNQAPQVVEQTFSIDENSANGTSVGTVDSFDPDGDVLSYSITNGNTNNTFDIDVSTGELIVANVSELDFETTPVFSLTVEVSDATLAASAIITINLNDVDESVNQAPQIVDQIFFISENSANGTIIGTVEATDPDNDVLAYSIISGNTNTAFAIDEATGALAVANVSELDFETNPSFLLTIQVEDAELNASATITINLVDVDESVNQAPQIVEQTFNIDENSANGTIVGTLVATDPDGDVLLYQIIGGNGDGGFVIDQNSGVLSVSNPALMDFEVNPSFNIVVEVSDSQTQASAAITINLNDVDESVNQAPQIVDQTFSIDENSVNGTNVGTVDSFDPDGDVISFSITNGDTNNAFDIDGTTGELTVANVSELDFETTPVFSLTVEISDAALTASATITINLNDIDESVNQAPQIVDQTFSIDENSTNGTIVGSVLATDPDGDVISYSITNGNANNAFDIDASTGELTVANVSELDFETTPVFSLTVEVSDAALNASAIITVNLNDVDESVNQAPQIVDQTFSIDENSANGTNVGIVDSFDPDGDVISYSITNGNTNNAFDMDTSTGELTVANVSELDFETTPVFSLTVEVSDAALTASAIITVNLNDIDESVNQAPQIVDQTFSLDENSANGTNVGIVDSFDPDGDVISYSVTNGNTNNAFDIDASTGELTVANVSELDFETTPVFSLTVEVSDAALNSSAIITVNLNDIDESQNNAPEISDQNFTVTENSDAGTLVGIVQATDADNDVLSYSITSGNIDNAFAISPSNGELLVINSNALDFATNPSFNLTVSVSDGVDEASATINITVEEAMVTSIDDLNERALFVYPNPANDFIQLENLAEFRIEKIELVDMTGRIARIDLLDYDGPISLGHLKPGLYHILIHDQNHAVHRLKFIKN